MDECYYYYYYHFGYYLRNKKIEEVGMVILEGTEMRQVGNTMRRQVYVHPRALPTNSPLLPSLPR